MPRWTHERFRAEDLLLINANAFLCPAGIGFVISRIRQTRQCFWLFCMVLAATGLADARASDGPSAQAVIRPSASIVLDGRLDEPVWRDAPVLKLTQQSPKPGEPTPYET